MLGPIIIVLVTVVVIPVGVLMLGAAAASVISNLATRDAEARHEGSELIATNY